MTSLEMRGAKYRREVAQVRTQVRAPQRQALSQTCVGGRLGSRGEAGDLAPGVLRASWRVYVSRCNRGHKPEQDRCPSSSH